MCCDRHFRGASSRDAAGEAEQGFGPGEGVVDVGAAIDLSVEVGVDADTHDDERSPVRSNTPNHMRSRARGSLVHIARIGSGLLWTLYSSRPDISEYSAVAPKKCGSSALNDSRFVYSQSSNRDSLRKI